MLQLAGTLRPLPWRATRDPWAVLVSEMMLQQTQALRVVEPWRAFLGRFPDPAACAAAPVGTVLEAWAGLGYNRRGLQLHRAASAVVQRFAGRIPADEAELRRLPGIGPYTARAVLAFAFERDVAVVDTNVGRVLARAVAGVPLEPWLAAAQQLADRLLPEGQAWAWNQSIMELGATICTARSPRCTTCPLQDTCRWVAAGRLGPDPWRPASRQGPFHGSDRQGRGRLVAALRRGPLPLAELAAAAGWDDDTDRARRIADGLVADGLAVCDEERLRLP